MEFRDSLEAAAFIRARGFYSKYLSSLLGCSPEYLKDIFKDELYKNNFVIKEAKKELSILVDTEFYESYQDLREEMMAEVILQGGSPIDKGWALEDCFELYEEFGILILHYLKPGEKSESTITRAVEENGFDFIRLIDASKEGVQAGEKFRNAVNAQRNRK